MQRISSGITGHQFLIDINFNDLNYVDVRRD